MKQGLAVRNQKERARLATSGCEKRTEERKVFGVGHSGVEKEKKEKGRKLGRRRRESFL